MTTFQKLLITALFFLGIGIFYYAYQLTMPKPIVPTVAERCFDACEISAKIPECDYDTNKLNKLSNLKGNDLLNFVTQQTQSCQNACLLFCRQYPNPEYFKP